MEGYSLVEMTLVIVLLGILAVSVFHGMLSGVDIYLIATRDYLNLFQEGRTALEKMAREIRETSPGDVSIGTGSVSFTKESDHVTPMDASETVVFSQSGSEIRRTTDLGTFTLVDHVEPGSFAVSQDANGVVTIDFTLTSDRTDIPLRTSIQPRIPDGE